MFQNILTSVTFRSLFLWSSGILSMIFVMIVLNIMTVDEATSVLHLSKENSEIFRSVICRSRELANGLFDILVQTLNKLFAWAGTDTDFGRLNIGGMNGCDGISTNVGGGVVNPELNDMYERIKGSSEAVKQ